MTTLDKQSKDKQAKPDHSFVASRAIRVLVVDEEEPLTNVVSLALRFEGWDVSTAPSGAIAVERAIAEPFDAILLDLGLPDMNGVQVVEQLRAQGISTPIVVVSGRSDLEDRLAAFGAGADEYITKPFGLDEVARTLTKIFRRLGLSASSICFDDIVLDVQTGKAWRDGERLMLSPVECELLRVLIADDSRTWHVTHFVSHLATAGFAVTPSQAERHISALAATVNGEWTPLIVCDADGEWMAVSAA